MVLRNELALNGVVAFLDSSDRNQVTDQRFLRTKTIACGAVTLAVTLAELAAGAYSCRLRKIGPAHCYLRIPPQCRLSHTNTLYLVFLHGKAT